ncbi:MAG TPA: ROK family protein [Candidatus Limnocylindrales bacterium]
MVDRAGVVRSAPALAWKDIDLRGRLERALGDTGFPVGVDSGVMLAALAEHRYGSHAGTSNMVYLPDHAGAGVGVVNGGVALRSGRPATVSGLSTLLLRTRFEAADGLAAERHLEVADLVRRARAGDQRVLAALGEFGAWLGNTVGILVNLFDPQTVLLGGYHAALAPWTLPAIERTARSIAATPEHARVRLAVSALGHEAAALGGAATALNRR